MSDVRLSVAEFVAATNQALDYAFSGVMVEGEVASYKVNQGKWVFFDLKDAEASVGCFMTLYQMRFPLTDGMKVVVRGTPKLTAWGKFSLTVAEIIPVGEGTIKKSFEILKKKLEKEGLFDPAKKRPIPEEVAKIGVISSTQAAGYVDFIKILGERWGGMEVQVTHTQVQGMGAADQIVKALKYFNERGEVNVIAVVRGGGSADDLAVFNDELLVREIAASKIPVVTGIGHEVDESLVDLAADVCASTPSNAAQKLTRDKRMEIENTRASVERINNLLNEKMCSTNDEVRVLITNVGEKITDRMAIEISNLQALTRVISELNPESVLARGYAIVRGDIDIGSVVEITTNDQVVNAEVKNVKKRINN
jgi:exodeoxyribonuclease VII large subunit